MNKIVSKGDEKLVKGECRRRLRNKLSLNNFKCFIFYQVFLLTIIPLKAILNISTLLGEIVFKILISFNSLYIGKTSKLQDKL